MSVESFTSALTQYTDLPDRTALLLFYLYIHSKVTGRMK